MKTFIIPVTPMEQNCTLLVCGSSGAAAVVDPGGDLDMIMAEINRQQAHVEQVLLTHGHIDHCGGASELSRRLGVPIVGPQREDAFWIDNLPQQCTYFGFPPAVTFTPDRWLEHGDRVRIGETELEVRHCPGHTPGHVVFFSPCDRLLIAGDVIFRGAIGRTDFPRGNLTDLVRAIREHIFTLDDDVMVLPGHGPPTRVGDERRGNLHMAERRYG
jgi:hydroxyacylglutathione hydrolase